MDHINTESIYKVSKALSFFDKKNVSFIGDSGTLKEIRSFYENDTDFSEVSKKESTKRSYIFSDHPYDDKVIQEYFSKYTLKLYWGSGASISLYELK